MKSVRIAVSAVRHIEEADNHVTLVSHSGDIIGAPRSVDCGGA